MLSSAYDMLYSAVVHLPVVIHIDPQQDCYHIRDNSCKVIWADDMPGTGYAELLRCMVLSINAHYPNAMQVEPMVEQFVQAYRARQDEELLVLADPKADPEVFVDIKLHFGNGSHACEISLATH